MPIPLAPLAIGDLVVGGSSLLGSLFGGITGNKATKQTNATNLQIARENNALQQKIAAENNQLQVDMMRENNKFSRDMAIEMFNLENEYNNPSAQVQRLLEAGLNPATMYGSGSIANSGDISTPSAAGSTVSPSMPSFTTPIMQSPPSVLGAMFGSLESVTRSLTNLSQAGLNKQQQVKISSLLTAELDKMLAEKDNIEISNQVKKFTFELDKVFSYLERGGKLNETYNNAYKLYNEGLLALVKQDTEKAEQAFKDAQSALSKNQSRQVEEMLPVLVKTQEETVKLVQEQQNTEKAKQSNLYAGADLSRANAKTANELRDSEVKLRKAIANKEHETWKMFNAYIEELYSAYHAQLDAAGISKELMQQKVQEMQRNNDWGEVNQFLNAASSVVSGFTSIGSMFKSPVSNTYNYNY